MNTFEAGRTGGFLQCVADLVALLVDRRNHRSSRDTETD
jgi:hypothetical protein